MIKKTANQIDSGAYPEFAPNQILASGASVVVTDAYGKAWVIDPHSGTAKLLITVHTKAR